VFRARGLSPAQAEQRAAALLGEHEDQTPGAEVEAGEDVVGSAGGSSFVAFASGAAIPILPLVVTSGRTAIVIAAVLVGVALLPPGRPSGC
jgi:VIT1/CCC1 family predicted Fe2+/Mn2+ transporter